jgi:methylenetetrahydrofolate dehydrogenase (NADP+)/methenyltetrahydrofolate cyclohydrolase
MLLLNGTAVAKLRRESLKAKIAEFTKSVGRAPALATILVGDDPASHVYVKNKRKTCGEIGIKSIDRDLPGSTTQEQLLAAITELNNDNSVDGILVQLPLPKHLDSEQALETLAPEKDPDGLTYENLGLLWGGKKRVAPCTPSGVMKILEHYKIDVAGKRAVVIGRSNIVGKPMAHLLQEANATVTVVHSRTPDIKVYTREADIVVVAAGKERFIGKEAFKKDSVVIDVGMHRPTMGEFANKLCGDVKFEELEGHVMAATPVPGGVGPMTIQMLLENTLDLAKQREGKRK